MGSAGEFEAWLLNVNNRPSSQTWLMLDHHSMSLDWNSAGLWVSNVNMLLGETFHSQLAGFIARWNMELNVKHFQV